jgi:hypothetical protein
MKIFIYSILIFSLIDCSQSTGAKQYNNQNVEINTDSLKRFARKEFKVVDIRLKKDTLCIVSTYKALYYPFGIYNNFNGFYNEYLNKGDYKYIIDSTFNFFKIISIKRENSKLEIIENTETNRIELLSAIVNDNSFELFDGIRIGISRTELLLKFFTNIPIEIKDIPVIELKSGVDGVWYYCSFSQEILKKIVIETDYNLNK